MTPTLAKNKSQAKQDFSTDAPLYRSIVRGLQYLIITKPDLSFAVNYVSQRMHEPTQEDFLVVKWILRYLSGTLLYGIFFTTDTLDLQGFSDLD